MQQLGLINTYSLQKLIANYKIQNKYFLFDIKIWSVYLFLHLFQRI